MNIGKIALAAVMLVSATAAYANDGAVSQSSSTGSVTVSVYIPPIGASLRAAQEGAVGLWSVSGRNSGLLLKLHDDDTGAGYSAVSVYSRAEVGIEARWESGESAFRSAPMNDIGGLNKSTYAVPKSSALVRTLTIAGV